MIETSLDSGRYELEGVLGHGGMALVYLAHDRELDAPVAVKMLADNLAANPDVRRRFAREAILAERLRHPNIVRVLGHGETAERAYIVLEYVEGGDLAEELRKCGRLDSDRVALLGSQAASGLAHAHDHGLVHRDVKPHNLLLTADGTVKVSDFGIARVVAGTRLTQAGSILGTAAYLAPEHAAGDEATGAADVYSLGAVLYELLTGEPLFRAATLTELLTARSRPPASPSTLVPEVPCDLESLVLGCLLPDPAQRPSMRDVELTLRGDMEAPTRVVDPARAGPTAVLRRARSGRRRAALAAAAACATAGAVGLGLALSGGSATRTPRPAPAQLPPIPPAATPAGAATNLARWLRAQSR